MGVEIGWREDRWRMDQLFMTDVVIKKNGSQENRVPYSCWPYQELQTHSATIIESWAAARLIKMHRISSRKFHESQRGKRARFQDDRLAKVCHQSSNENNCLIRGREGVRSLIHTWEFALIPVFTLIHCSLYILFLSRQTTPKISHDRDKINWILTPHIKP